jgi:hypothetical protein
MVTVVVVEMLTTDGLATSATSDRARLIFPRNSLEEGETAVSCAQAVCPGTTEKRQRRRAVMTDAFTGKLSILLLPANIVQTSYR